MKNEIKTKTRVGNKQGGFLEIIVIIIIALLIMRYYGITITDAIHWFTSFFAGVLR